MGPSTPDLSSTVSLPVMSSTTASSSTLSGSNGSCTSTSSSSSTNGTPPIITTTAPEHSATIPSFAAIRRARADTLPSRPSSLAFLAGSGRGVGTGAGDDSIGSAGTSVAAFSQLDSKSTRPLRRTPSFLVPPHLSTRHRSGSLTLPSASISAAFGPSIFTSTWGEPASPGSDRPATTPTTREMMFDSENENAIMSTLDALGLDDPVSVPGQPGNQSIATSSVAASNSPLDGLGSRSRSSSFASLPTAVNGTSEMHLHKTAMDASLLMPSLGLANRFRSYSVTAKPTYQEVLEDEQGDNIGQLTSSSPSSGSSSAGVVYPATSAGGVHQFHQTHSRPRAISMGFLEIPNDIADEQRRFALTGPRSYSDMKARQTHQRTTSAGADRLAEIVANSSSLSGSAVGSSSSSSSTSVSATAATGPVAAAASSTPGINHSTSSSSGSSITHTHSHTSSSSSLSTAPSLGAGAVASIKALSHGRTSSLNLASSTTSGQHGLGMNRVQDDVTLGHHQHHPQHHHHLLALHQHHLESSGLNVSFTADRQELNGASGGHSGSAIHFSSNPAGTPPGTLTPPLQENGFSSANVTQQVPTRSLWIGNLDPSLTTNDLMKLCSPYGQIESLRVLPDKECAFVNFLTVEDAVRAKEDISERCGGRVGNHVVRVGFGKTEGLMNPDSSNALQSTRALWIGNLPSATTPVALHSIFSHFGPIESARVLAHKSCGFINFENIEDAITAKKIMHGQEAFGPGTGAIRVGFAKVPTKQSPSESPNTLQNDLGGSEGMINADSKSGSSTSLNTLSKQQQQEIEGKAEFDMMLNMMSLANTGQSLTSSSSAEKEVSSPEDTVFERLAMMQEFDKDADAADAAQELRLNLEPISYYSSIPAVPEPSPRRRLDAPRLREIRKRLDSGHCTVKEVDALASECMDEIVELCSDYIGNTVIQKFFERSSETQKTKMLELIAPHLASIGIHKNGTWAAQKIIECAKTTSQIDLICAHLRPYTPPLLLDQFGNYVVQCCLRLGAQHNEFIFQAMADKFWEIAQGRFGARAMRASLESQHVTKRQQKQVAVAVVQNSLALATNPNGALLLTWLLDNSQLAGRYRVLAPRLTPHVASLATHKLASLTVLKVINQRQEADARDLLLKAISTNDAALEEILGDQVHGISLIQKILASPHVELAEKQALAEKVKLSLQKLNVLNVQGCKRLMEEIKVVLGGGEDVDGKHPGGSTTAAMQGALANSLLVYPQQEFAATAANFYVAMATNQQQQQQQHLQAQMAIKAVPPSPSSEAVGDHSPPPSHHLGSTGAGAAGKGPEAGNEMNITNGGAGGAGGASMTQGAFVAHPTGFYAPMPSQMFGGYPGHQLAAAAAFYPNGLYVPHQAITTMYHPGMMAAAAGFNPYLALAAGMNGTDAAAAAAAAAAGMAAAGMAAQLNGSTGMFLPHQGGPPHGMHHHPHHHLAQPHMQPPQFQAQPPAQQPPPAAQQQQQQQ